MELFLSLCMGVALSAACGFRVFVPLLVVSAAANAGHLTLAENFAWLSTRPALVAFAAASLIEVAAYFIPVIDNLLDTIASPAAVVAGILLTASVLTDIDPFFRWALALIAGGGTAGAVQVGTVLGRGASTASSAGLANPLFATFEFGGALVTSLIAIIAPVVAVLFFLGLILLVRRAGRLLRPRPASSAPQSSD